MAQSIKQSSEREPWRDGEDLMASSARSTLVRRNPYWRSECEEVHSSLMLKHQLFALFRDPAIAVCILHTPPTDQVAVIVEFEGYLQLCKTR